MSSASISEEDLKKEMEELKEELQCAVCLEILQKPVMILPCLHSFCALCLDSHISSSSSSSSSSSPSSSPSPCKCPVCRQEFSTSGGGKGGAQENPFLDSQVDRLEELRRHFDSISDLSSLIKECDVCETPNKRDASLRCVDCKENLCEGCNKFHLKFNKTHKVLDISEASDIIISSSSPLQHPPCPHHPSKELDLMCLKCEVPICSFCSHDGDHKSHEASPIEDVIDQKKGKLSDLVDSVQDRHKDLDKSLTFIDLMETKIQESLIFQKAKILKEMEELRIKAIQQIDQRQEELLNELETKSNKKLENLAQQRKRLEADLSCLENSVKVSRSFLKNASGHQLSSHLHLLSDQLTRLKEDTSLLQPPVEITSLDTHGSLKLDLSSRLLEIKIIEKTNEEVSRLVFEAQTSSTRQKSRRRPNFHFECDFISSITSPFGIAINSKRQTFITTPDSDSVRVFDASGNFIKSFGSRGTRNGQFQYPTGITCFNDRILVCDSGNHRIQFFDSQGLYIGQIGKNGGQPGMLYHPKGLALDKSNRIIVCDTGNNRIQIFDTRGAHLKSFGTRGSGNGQFEAPYAVTVDRNDNILVSDTLNNRIQIFDNQGTFLKSFGTRGSGNGQLKAPYAVTVDRDDNILVSDTDNHRIQIFDNQGNYLHTVGEGGKTGNVFHSPIGLNISEERGLLVCDQRGSKIQLWTECK